MSSFLSATLVVIFFTWSQVPRPCNGTQLSLPPCTSTLCIKPCGYSHLNTLAVNVSGYPLQPNSTLTFLTITISFDISLNTLKGKVDNIYITVPPAQPVPFPDYSYDYCIEYDKINGTSCPIKANVTQTFFGSRDLRDLEGQKVTARGRLYGDNNVMLLCLELSAKAVNHKHYD